MDTEQSFEEQRTLNIAALGADEHLQEASRLWKQSAGRHQYGHNFSWLGRPIIQLPQDMVAMQEIVWNVKPDLIIETGIAHGGSLILSASMLALLDYCEAVGQGAALNPWGSKRRVLGIDIEIRPHNREAIEEHPMSHLIEMIEGSSVAPDVVEQVRAVAKGHEKILVFLDSNHTHDHVLSELTTYAPLTSVGSYCVVWDSGIEDLPAGYCADRPWGKGNNPKTAVREYLRCLESGANADGDGSCVRFEIDKFIDYKLAITSSTDGFLKRVK